MTAPTAAAATGGAAAGASATDPPGWYCYTSAPRLAEWDGVAWTGATHAAASAPSLPGPPGALAFVRQPWFRWMALGQALTVLPAILSGTTGSAWWSWISVVGYLAFLSGGVMAVTRYLGLDGIEGRRALTWIGIGSGVVAFGIGVGLEVLVDHLAGWSTTLWSTGPIEEGGKLLVPVLLLTYGAPRFRVPRVGLYLVLVSGATVGILEGAEYEGRPDIAWAHLQMAILRPSAELLHVFVTGFAAAVIWLAAWRRHRVCTSAGAVAFLLAAGIHSFHDGLITFFHVTPRSFDSSLAQTLGQAIDRGMAGGAFALVLAGLLYLLARHAARELTAPGRIATCPPSWRPQIKTWGCDPPAPADQWSAGVAPAVPAAPWAPTPVFATLPPMPVPAVAPPGWYVVGGDPRLQGWWAGSSWLHVHRWDGYRWVPV